MFYTIVNLQNNIKINPKTTVYSFFRRFCGPKSTTKFVILKNVPLNSYFTFAYSKLFKNLKIFHFQIPIQSFSSPHTLVLINPRQLFLNSKSPLPLATTLETPTWRCRFNAFNSLFRGQRPPPLSKSNSSANGSRVFECLAHV
jgi:hypothetical protein